MTRLRRWVANRLMIWASRIHDDWHTWELTAPNGERMSFTGYGQYAASWPESWVERCSCDCEDLR